MGLWGGIKYALNSSLGTQQFEPLDVTLGKKADTASATAASSMFSVVRNINDNVLKKPKTFFTTVNAIPITTAGTVVLSLTGAGTINTITFMPYAAGTFTITITIDGAVLATASFTGTAGTNSIITTGGTNGISFGSVLATATSLPFLFSNFLNIRYAKNIEIKITPASAATASVYISHTREV